MLEEDFAWTFTIQGPYVLRTEPAYGDHHVGLTQPITVAFSQPMDRVSTEAAFSLESTGGQSVSGRFSWNQLRTVMTFFP